MKLVMLDVEDHKKSRNLLNALSELKNEEKLFEHSHAGVTRFILPEQIFPKVELKADKSAQYCKVQMLTVDTTEMELALRNAIARGQVAKENRRKAFLTALKKMSKDYKQVSLKVDCKGAGYLALKRWLYFDEALPEELTFGYVEAE